jgi:fibronectin-binding autotransporter adhesin
LTVSGTLGGDGSITSPGTIIFTGGELDPSSLAGGPGTLTIDGDLLLSDTTQLSFTLDTGGIVDGGMNDLVVVNGNLTLDGVLSIADLPSFGVGTYRLFNYSGSLIDNGVSVASKQYVLDFSTAGQVNLIVLPVPEPGSGLLLLLGLVGLRRRQRSQ